MAEHLIDISGYNGISDWGAVFRDGIVGASIKTTQASNYVNPLAPGQAAGARAVGVKAGAYHFGDPRVSVRAQTDYFVRQSSAVKLLDPGSLAPMYDVENWPEDGLIWSSHEQITDHVSGWLEQLHAELGIRRAFVYGSESWWTGGWIRPDDFAIPGMDVINWIAKYNGDPGNTAPWADARDGLHQHTSKGRVPGIPGDVDKNVTLSGRTIEELLIDGEGGSGMGLADWKAERMFERILSMSGGVEGQNFDGVQFTFENNWRTATTAQLAQLIELLQGGIPALVDLADRVDALEQGGVTTDVQVDAAVQRQFDRPDGPLSRFLRDDRSYGFVPAPVGPPPTGQLVTRRGEPVPAAVADQWDTASAEPVADVPEQGRGGAE